MVRFHEIFSVEEAVTSKMPFLEVLILVTDKRTILGHSQYAQQPAALTLIHRNQKEIL